MSSSHGKQSSFLCVFCLIVCINLAVIVFLSVNLFENQTHFETLRRTDQMRRLQMLEDQELKQYRKMELIQSVHYRKTNDQRAQDQDDQYSDKYLDMQRLNEWIVNIQNNEYMKNAQAESIQYQVEQDVRDLNVYDQNMPEVVIQMLDEKVQEMQVNDLEQQDPSTQTQRDHDQEEQGKEREHEELGMIDQDVKEPGQSVYKKSQEDKDKNAQGESTQNIEHIDRSGINMQDQTQFLKMENNEHVPDKQEKGINVQDQENDSTGIQSGYEHNQEKGSEDNTNEQALKKEGVTVQVQDKDNHAVHDLEEQDLKKQEQGKQYEKKLDIVQQPNKKDQDVMEEPNQQHVKTPDKEDQNVNDQDLKDKHNLQEQKQIVQDQAEQTFQEQHQLLKEYLKLHAGLDLNDSTNGKDKVQIKIGRLFNQYTAELRVQHERVNDQELGGEVTVSESEVPSRKLIDDSHGSDEEAQTKPVTEDETQKTLPPSTD